MEEILLSHSAGETKQIAADLVRDLKKGATICLYGELAAGKTTFAQGVAGALGIKRLTSPTFIIMREYQIDRTGPIKRLFHLDLYRLNDPEEIKAFDLEEITSDQENVVLIEWPERIQAILPKKRIDIYFEEKGGQDRQLIINKMA